MDVLEQTVKRTIEQNHILEPGDRVIAAVSGGADSVCLLNLLSRMRGEDGIELRCVHVHHGLRDGEADRDADFVSALCAELDVPCHIIRVDVKGFAAGKGMSEEEAARFLRYAALEQEALSWEKHGEEATAGPPVKIAAAHHSDDQAETILHNMFRGTGLGGLKGIAYIRGRIIRPLLDVRRRDILQWIESHGLSFVEDSTNASDHYTRNRIRSQILPQIQEKVNSGAVGNILRLGKLASQADEYLAGQAKQWIAANVAGSPGPGQRKNAWGRGDVEPACRGDDIGPACHRIDMESVGRADSMEPLDCVAGAYYIPGEAFAAEPDIIRSYVIMELLGRLAGTAKDLGLVHVQQVTELWGRPVGKQASLCYGLEARREYGGIWIGRPAPASVQESGHLPVVQTEIFSCKKGIEFPKNKYTKWFDCDKIKGTPEVRTRRPGDYITLEDGNRKPLRRFMIDEKIPRQMRDQIPLLADGSHVMWVIGYRISGFYKMDPETVRVFEATVKLSGDEENR